MKKIYNRDLAYLSFFLLSWVELGAQSLSGTIFDEQGMPLPGITVQEGNTNNATITNNAGAFELILNTGNTVVLNFRHISYEVNPLKFIMTNSDTSVNVVAREKKIPITEVEIVASPSRQLLTQSYSQTEINSESIEEKIATSFIDVLEEVPGITKQAEYHSPMALRGLGGKRLLVTKDGNRRMGNFSNGFMGQGINIYDLEKVEVIKGPASVKYGPGAITGIINMESKYPFKKPGMHGRALTSYGANNNEKTVLSGMNWAGLDHAVSFSVRFRDAGDYKNGKGETATNSSYRDKDLRGSYSWENNHALMLTAESELHLGGPWGRPVGFNGTKYINMVNWLDNTWHSSITSVWRPKKIMKSLELSVYFDKEKRRQVKDSYDVGTGRLSYREDVYYDNYYAGWRGLSVLFFSKNIKLNVGTDGVYFRIKSPIVLTDYFLTTTIKNKVTKNAGVFLTGLFAEAEYKPVNSRIRLRSGLRGDFSRINEGDVHDTLLANGRKSDVEAWSGMLGMIYSTHDKIFFSFQVARSCRMPDAPEMFIMTSNTDGFIYGNSSLTPEYGFNFDAGIRGELGSCTFDYSLFSNFLHDFISLEYWKNSGKKGINYTYYNIERARISGAELSLGTRFIHVLHPDNKVEYTGTFVFTRGDKLTDEPGWFCSGVPLRNIPPFNLNQSVTIRRLLTSAKSFYIGSDVRYYALQDRIAPSEDGGYISPAYCLIGASAGFTYQHQSVKWELKLRGDNLTNNYYRPLESLVYGMGRNLKILLSIVF